MFYTDVGYSCGALGRLVDYHLHTFFSVKAWDLLLLGEICFAGEAESRELKLAHSSFPLCNCSGSSNSLSGQQKHFVFSILSVSMSYFSSSETSAD